MKQGIIALLLIAVALGAGAAGLTETTATIVDSEKIGTFDSGMGEGASEIVVFDPDSIQLLVVNAAQTSVDVVDIVDPASPRLVRRIDVARYGASANSVAVHDGVVAVAVEAEIHTNPGSVVFFTTGGRYINEVRVGALPDMVTFTPDGRYVLVANEGEPNDDYTIDPEGSVSVIDIRGGVESATVRFADVSRITVDAAAFAAAGGRVYGPGASPLQDAEPEYITVSDDSRTAWVGLQENNTIVEIDVRSARVTAVYPLGYKDHTRPENAFDASNRDGRINITTHPTWGLYQPDAIDSFSWAGRTYLVTANEGDARDYDGFSEEARVADLVLDPVAYPNAAVLQEDANLGRLKTTTVGGDFDGDGDVDQILSYGARSITVWTPVRGTLRRVGDTGAQIETRLARLTPEGFNANDGIIDEFDERSDDKGPEPEGVVVGMVAGRPYAFVGLERALGGVMVFDLSVPGQPEYVTYILSNDGTGAAGNDVSPEGLAFIPAAQSPTGSPLLVASYEVSGTVAIYDLHVSPRR